jgi:hypothetical protein
MPTDALLQCAERAWCCSFVGEECVVNLDGTVPPWRIAARASATRRRNSGRKHVQAGSLALDRLHLSAFLYEHTQRGIDVDRPVPKNHSRYNAQGSLLRPLER